MGFLETIQEFPVIKALFRIRFIRFGLVGFSGTLINMGVLYVNQSILLRQVHPPDKRLHISLAIAICIATFNNYLWNRYWTWGDRQRHQKRGFFAQMAQYYLSCTVAILLQYVLTTLLAAVVHYLIANLISIALAAIFVYVINDIWTFSIGNGKKRSIVSPPRAAGTEKGRLS
ncbi:MAG: GtrA family protein [Deltaproteobacteria bacterium]|nr:GtrA family protein [Deltaproteobacteria bacterium]